MSAWSLKRRIIIFSFLIIVFIVIVSLIISVFLYEEPSCYDGIQNNEETGIDCGRECDRVCSVDAEPIKILWSRLIPDGEKYDAIAYIQNPNTEFVARDIPYSFNLYDKDGLPIHKIENTIPYLPPRITSVVIDENEAIEEGIAESVFLEIGEFEWVYEKGEYDRNAITIEDEKLSVNNLTVSATVKNETLNTINNINLYATVFDENENVIAGTKSFINSLAGRSEKELIFLWKNPFVGTDYLCSAPIDLTIFLATPNERFNINALEVIEKLGGSAEVVFIHNDEIAIFPNIEKAKEAITKLQANEEIEIPSIEVSDSEERKVLFVFGERNKVESIIIENNLSGADTPTYFFSFAREYADVAQKIFPIAENTFFVQAGGADEITDIYRIVKSENCNASPIRAEVVGVPEL